MNWNSVPEIVMLVCFGASWPFNLRKTWSQKSAQGKSFAFLGLVFVGYIGGITHKILNGMDAVLVLWIAIEVMVAADIALCLYYRHKERQLPPPDTRP